MLDRILLPIDFSEQSMMMVDCADEFKQLGSKHLTLLHVPPARSITNEDRRRLEEMEVKLHDKGIEVRAVIRPGNTVQIIVEEAEDENVDMIVMASGGKGRAEEFFVGSTSFGVLRRTSKPVLLDKLPEMIHQGKPKECRLGVHLFRKALIAVDLPACSGNLENLLSKLCERGLKEVVLLHVVDSAKYKVNDDLRFRGVQRELEDFKSRIAREGCNIITHVHFGTPAYNILEVQREMDASLIILGTKQRSYLAGLTLGSTSEEVVRKSTVPLLVVPC
jgi:nucleotide-binding universal stress UspA family protein